MNFLVTMIIIVYLGLDMDTREYVVKRILDLCDEKRLSINGLARISALPPSTLKNIINGASRNPGVVTLKKICDGLEISLIDFFNTDEFRTIEQEIR